MDFATATAAVCAAVMRLRGAVLEAELGRVVRALLCCPEGAFLPSLEGDAAAGILREPVRAEGFDFGCFVATGRTDWSDQERSNLVSLAALTGTLLQMQSFARRSTRAFAQVEAQLAHQSQILDQIQESVLTTDLLGNITSWNKGAERMFGYSALEAIGAHSTMLYADEHTPFPENPTQF
ncbi:MAG TPA: PAS domain S-box protein, partial [Telluria sp.]|nr:PAS domain S-box protein [Telluria sp.]